MLAYNRRISRLVYLVIGVIVLLALLVGFVGAFTHLGGVRREYAPPMRRSFRRPASAGPARRAKAAGFEAAVSQIAKADLVEALRQARESLARLAEAPVHAAAGYANMTFVLIVAGPVTDARMKALRGFVGVPRPGHGQSHRV